MGEHTDNPPDAHFETPASPREAAAGPSRRLSEVLEGHLAASRSLEEITASSSRALSSALAGPDGRLGSMLVRNLPDIATTLGEHLVDAASISDVGGRLSSATAGQVGTSGVIEAASRHATGGIMGHAAEHLGTSGATEAAARQATGGIMGQLDRSALSSALDGLGHVPASSTLAALSEAASRHRQIVEATDSSHLHSVPLPPPDPSPAHLATIAELTRAHDERSEEQTAILLGVLEELKSSRATAAAAEARAAAADDRAAASDERARKSHYLQWVFLAVAVASFLVSLVMLVIG